MSEIDTQPMKEEGTALVAQATAIMITNDEQYQNAGSALIAVKTHVRKIQDAFREPKKAAHEAHKKITALEGSLLEIPQKAEGILKAKLGEWQVAESKRIREEERRLAEEARKREEEIRIHEAVQLEEAGHVDLAESVIAEPVVAPIVSIPKPAVRGITTTMQRSFRVVDPSKVKREFLIIDEVAIRKVVQALGKDAESVVGGIVFEEVPVTRVSSR